MQQVAALQDSCKMKEGAQAKLKEEQGSKLATVHTLTEELKELREVLRRIEAREVPTRRS